MNPYEALLGLLRGGGEGLPQPNIPNLDGAGTPGIMRRGSGGGGQDYGFPTRPCPTCGGSGVVPDIESMRNMMGSRIMGGK